MLCNFKILFFHHLNKKFLLKNKFFIKIVSLKTFYLKKNLFHSKNTQYIFSIIYKREEGKEKKIKKYVEKVRKRVEGG